MLEGDEFVRRVVPSLSRLFASSDRNLRRNLLEAIDSFGPHLTQVCVTGTDLFVLSDSMGRFI
jgi:SCY1-like protein 1